MKILFVGFECENYAISLFSSLLKQQGHQVYLIFDSRLFNTDEVKNRRLAKFFDIRKYNLSKIKEINPDLIGFSVYTQDYRYAVEFAKMIKSEMDTPIIFGGIHCILCPEEVIKEDCIDIVCVGEGERAIEEIAKNPANTAIESLWFRKSGSLLKNLLRPLIQDLDILPFIDKDIYYDQYPIFKKGYTISTGRNCPYTCAFCASDSLNRIYRENNLGNPIRQRSADNVIKELITAKRKYNPENVYFTDDVFTINTQWLREFAYIYKNVIGLPFYCTANPGTIKDEELKLLKYAGCQMIGFGMQSCNEEYRNEYLKRRGTNVRIKRVAEICHQIGLHFSFDHIFNLPMEKIENQMEAIRFYNETRPDIINTFTMTYLPKIELNKYLDEKTRKEIENGKSPTGMFIRDNNAYASLFVVLPLLSPNFINFLYRKNLIKFIKLPYFIRLFLKDIKRLIIGRYSDIFFPIQLFLINIWKGIKIKLKKEVKRNNIVQVI